jgi:hypothetical protein
MGEEGGERREECLGEYLGEWGGGRHAGDDLKTDTSRKNHVIIRKTPFHVEQRVIHKTDILKIIMPILYLLLKRKIKTI